MAKRATNRVLYLDQHVAIIEGDVQGSVSDVLPYMLKVGTNEREPLAPVSKMLASVGSPVAGAAFVPGITPNDLDTRALYELGFTCVAMGTPSDGMGVNIVRRRDSSAPLSGASRMAISLDFVDMACSAAKYVARLYLASMGDARQDVITTDGDRFVTVIPMFGKHGRPWLPLDALGTSRFLYKATVQEASDSRSAHVVFQTLSAHTGAQGAASCLLASILYACGTVLYEPQPAGPPTCNAISSIPRAIYDAGQAGQLIACPHCGWPVLKKTAGTMPYCRDSHRTRFNEDRQVAAARKLLAEGKGWTEIKRAIPTITNKLYKKALEKQEA